ncbi:MAG: CDP-alcohol phosphatidyltransferase family protein [Chloroflexota bacterium]|nr:CDP-alcohol phosphatidyltransferase family protein [Chloroflexota bacterium]
MADALTGLRFVLLPIIAWIALTWERTTGHGMVALLTLLAWTTDVLDGPLARRAHKPTRLGRYDLPIDAGLTLVLGLCLVTWGALSPLVVGGTLAAAGAGLWLWRVRAPLIVAMGLIYGSFVITIWQAEPLWGRAIATWVTLDIVLRPTRVRQDVTWFLGQIGHTLRFRRGGYPPHPIEQSKQEKE